MATVTKRRVAETVRSVTLELTLEEARTLAVVYSRVSGSFDSPRMHTQAVLRALTDVGITWAGAPEYDLLPSLHSGDYQSLYFSDYFTFVEG